MGKFALECPNCGRYVQASTNIFAKNKIDCSCGYTINVKTDRLSTLICPHCGNTVVYDQGKADKVKCPVCHEKINTAESLAALEEITCPTCSCHLKVDKNASAYTCPLCDTMIDVQERIATARIKQQGLASVIKYEGGNDVFIWKHPVEDFNLGSQLIVHESQEAIFFRDGQALDLFGAGRYTLATQNLPLLENLYKLPTNTDEVFHSEVYFINLTTQMGIKWGTDSKIRLFDPASGLHIELGASGNFNLRVNNSRKLLLKLVGTASGLSQDEINGAGDFSTTSVNGKFRALIINRVKANLARIIRENSINVLAIDEQIDTISEALRAVINETLDEYGLVMPEFYITNVVTPDDDPNFRRLKQQFAERTLLVRQEEIRKAEAEAAQRRKIVEAQTEAETLKIKAQAEAEAYKVQAFAEAEEMRAKGYTYQQETARQVGLEAMKNGIAGEGGSTAGSVLGDIAGMGVALGAMGSVMGMTKDVIDPALTDAAAIGKQAVSPSAESSAVHSWNCPNCGFQGISSKFCPECGTPRPAQSQPWDCPKCGAKGNTTKFCPQCGAPQPKVPEPWDCPKCGAKGNTTKFCPECGSPRPAEPQSWDCPKCGAKDNTTKFCPECGYQGME